MGSDPKLIILYGVLTKGQKCALMITDDINSIFTNKNKKKEESMKKSFLPVILAAIFLFTMKGLSDDYWVYPELGEIYVSARCFCQNDDKEIVFTGPGNDWDIWMTKIDSVGEIIYTKKIYDAAYQAVPKAILTAGKNCITVGIGEGVEDITSHATIIKTDDSGNVIKDTSWIPPGHTTAGFQDMARSDDGIVAVGEVSIPNYSGSCLHLVKFNENLEILWEKFYPGKSASKIVRDGNTYVTLQPMNGGKIYLIKFDQNGSIIWEEEYPEIQNFYAYNINVVTDGYLIIGCLNGWGNEKTCLIKTNKSGGFVWQKEYQFPELIDRHEGENCWEVNGEYVLLVREFKFLGERRLVKTDIDGNIISMKKCGKGGAAYSVLTPDEKIIISYSELVGEIAGLETKTCPAFYKTDCNFDSSIWHKENNQPQLWLSQNYPNPFNRSTCIQYCLPKDGDVNLVVYDMFGQKKDILIKKWQKSGQYSMLWQAKNCPSGVYVYRISTANQTICKKMLLIK